MPKFKTKTQIITFRIVLQLFCFPRFFENSNFDALKPNFNFQFLQFYKFKKQNG